LVSEVSASSATAEANRGPVLDDLLDRQPTDDRPQRPRQDLRGEGVDLRLLGEEPLRGGTDRILVTTDLDDRDPVEVRLDALAGHGTPDADRDAAAGEIHHVQALDERQHEHRRAHDDLLAAHVVRDVTGLRVLDRRTLAPGDHVGLVGPRDLDA
jgi:hypothetical protein